MYKRTQSEKSHAQWTQSTRAPKQGAQRTYTAIYVFHFAKSRLAVNGNAIVWRTSSLAGLESLNYSQFRMFRTDKQRTHCGPSLYARQRACLSVRARMGDASPVNARPARRTFAVWRSVSDRRRLRDNRGLRGHIGRNNFLSPHKLRPFSLCGSPFTRTQARAHA